MNRRIMLGALALYLAGAYLHLGLFRHESGTIWGDTGDGFFNLWVLAACVLQGLDASTIRARQTRYDESVIRPMKEEQAFFEALHGSLVVIPAHPFPRNTVPMLYFNGYPELRLMNGYSAKSTALWGEVMGLERRYGPCSREQVGYVVSRGVDYMAVRMDFIRPARAGWLAEAAGPPLFENNRWVVYAAANIGVLDDGIAE